MRRQFSWTTVYVGLVCSFLPGCKLIDQTTFAPSPEAKPVVQAQAQPATPPRVDPRTPLAVIDFSTPSPEYRGLLGYAARAAEARDRNVQFDIVGVTSAADQAATAQNQAVSVMRTMMAERVPAARLHLGLQTDPAAATNQVRVYVAEPASNAAAPTGFIGSRTEGLVLLLFTACCWGLTWPQSKYLLQMLPPFSMRASCGAAGCVVAFGLAALRRENMIPPVSQWGRLLMFSMLNYGAFIALTAKSLAWLSASQAVVLTYTLPIWASMFAWPMLGERPTARKILAVVLGVGGVMLMVAPGAGSSGAHQFEGAALALTAAMLFGLGTVIAKRRPLALPPVTSVAWQSGLGVLPVGLLALSEERDWSGVTPLGWAAIAYVAILPLTVAYVAWFRALRLVPASTAATTVLLSPLIGVIGSALLLGESLAPQQIVALGLTLAGVALAARG